MSFGHDFFKGKTNNAVCFGKTMENVRNRRDIQAVFHESEKFRRWVANPGFKSRNRVSANLVKAISIIDNTGKRITLPTVTLNNNVQVNTESLSTGIYHVQVVTAKGATTQRFVKL